jgi:hypothetical protein
MEPTDYAVWFYLVTQAEPASKAVFHKLWSMGAHQVVRGSFRRKSIAKIVSDTEQMKKKTYMSVLNLPLLVELQQYAGKSVLSLTYCPSIIIL